MKLTDSQFALLSNAARRSDRCAQVPINLRGRAAQKLVTKLLTGDLLEEIHAEPNMPVWCKREGGAFALRVTDAGLSAISVAPASNRERVATNPEAGVAKQKQRAERQNAQTRAGSKRPTNQTPRGSKRDAVITLLNRRQGATITSMMNVTNWQPHSVRGFLAGVVRKKLGLKLVSKKTGTERVYRIERARSPKPARSTAARRG